MSKARQKNNIYIYPWGVAHDCRSAARARVASRCSVSGREEGPHRDDALNNSRVVELGLKKEKWREGRRGTCADGVGNKRVARILLERVCAMWLFSSSIRVGYCGAIVDGFSF